MADDFVICPECGHEQADMGRNVACEECGGGPMPTADDADVTEARGAGQEEP